MWKAEISKHLRSLRSNSIVKVQFITHPNPQLGNLSREWLDPWTDVFDPQDGRLLSTTGWKVLCIPSDRIHDRVPCQFRQKRYVRSDYGSNWREAKRFVNLNLFLPRHRGRFFDAIHVIDQEKGHPHVVCEAYNATLRNAYDDMIALRDLLLSLRTQAQRNKRLSGLITDEDIEGWKEMNVKGLLPHPVDDSLLGRDFLRIVADLIDGGEF